LVLLNFSSLNVEGKRGVSKTYFKFSSWPWFQQKHTVIRRILRTVKQPNCRDKIQTGTRKSGIDRKYSLKAGIKLSLHLAFLNFLI
jgi:hypothetical protein